MPNLEKVKARAAKLIADAERQIEIVEMLPALEVPFCAGSPMQTTRGPWVTYLPRDWADVEAIMAAYKPATAYDCKTGASRGLYAIEQGDCQGEYEAWIQFDASNNLNPEATIIFFFTLADGQTARIRMRLAPRNLGLWHSDFGGKIVNLKPNATKYPKYKKVAPMFLANAAQVISYSTGTDSSGCWIGLFATFDCLNYAFDSVKGQTGR